MKAIIRNSICKNYYVQMDDGINDISTEHLEICADKLLLIISNLIENNIPISTNDTSNYSVVFEHNKFDYIKYKKFAYSFSLDIDYVINVYNKVETRFYFSEE